MTAHAQHRIHDNSRDAYHSESERISRRAHLVRNWIAAHGPSTDRDVMAGLGLPDMNSVRPRCTELVGAGVLVEVGRRRCRVTGKTVRVLDLSMTEKMR